MRSHPQLVNGWDRPSRRGAVVLLRAGAHPGALAASVSELLRAPGAPGEAVPLDILVEAATRLQRLTLLPPELAARVHWMPPLGSEAAAGVIEERRAGRAVVLALPGLEASDGWFAALAAEAELAARDGAPIGSIAAAQGAPGAPGAHAGGAGRIEDSPKHASALCLLSPALLAGDSLARWCRHPRSALRVPSPLRACVAHAVRARAPGAPGVPGASSEISVRCEEEFVDHAPVPQTLRAFRALLQRLELAARVADHPLAHGRLAELQLLAGAAARARAHARAALMLWPRWTAVELALARALVQLGETGRARAHLAELEHRLPLAGSSKARQLAVLGESWRRDGEREQAEEYFDRALALDPRQALALNGRAALDLESGRFDLAIGAIGFAARIEPLAAETWYHLGRTLAMSGHAERGRRMLAKALAIQPGQREARLLLTRLGSGARRREAAPQAQLLPA